MDSRLEGYFTALRSWSLNERLKRNLGNWPVYAAVSGSAMAMLTTASASLIASTNRPIPDSIASVRSFKEHLADPRHLAFGSALRFVAANELGRTLRPGEAARAIPANQTQVPVIAPGGVVPLDGTVNTIQPGEWISIYGSNLAPETATWNGDFPTSLGGVSVQIDGKPAYLMYVSPGQIDLQAPDDTARGTVSVVVTTAAGSGNSSVTLADVSPSFSVLQNLHVAGIIVRSDHSGAFGGGTYDILGPTGNSFGYPTVAAQAGDRVELFAVGFGPTDPTVAAGQAFTGKARITSPLSLYINNIQVRPSFVGLSSAGLYQINLVVPGDLGVGDVSIEAIVGGMKTQSGVLFSLQGGSVVYPVTTTGGFGTPGFGFTGGTGGTAPGGGGTGVGGGTGGGGTGGGGTSARPAVSAPAAVYLPKLKFPPE